VEDVGSLEVARLAHRIEREDLVGVLLEPPGVERGADLVGGEGRMAALDARCIGVH